MAGGPDGSNRPYFGTARTIGGLTLVFVASALVLLDVVIDTYTVDLALVGLLLGTGGLFLGVEVLKKLLGGG